MVGFVPELFGQFPLDLQGLLQLAHLLEVEVVLHLQLALQLGDGVQLQELLVLEFLEVLLEFFLLPLHLLHLLLMLAVDGVGLFQVLQDAFVAGALLVGRRLLSALSGLQVQVLDQQELVVEVGFLFPPQTVLRGVATQKVNNGVPLALDVLQ